MIKIIRIWILVCMLSFKFLISHLQTKMHYCETIFWLENEMILIAKNIPLYRNWENWCFANYAKQKQKHWQSISLKISWNKKKKMVFIYENKCGCWCKQNIDGKLQEDTWIIFIMNSLFYFFIFINGSYKILFYLVWMLWLFGLTNWLGNEIHIHLTPL